mgnify:CR=1 FL=1
MLNKRLERKSVKARNYEHCTMKTTQIEEQTFIRLPEVMIFQLERKSYNIEANASDHNGTSVVINKSLTIGNKQYQLRSIIYHKGADENMYGHFTCNCLVDCRPFVTGRRSKNYAQWFEFDEDKPIPLTEDDAISSDEVKKGCSLLFYQQREKKIEVINGN